MNVIVEERPGHETERDLRARNEQQRAVAELGRLALEGADLTALMNEAVTLVARSLGVGFSELFELVPAGDALLLHAGVGWGPEAIGRVTVEIGRDSQIGQALLSGTPVIIDDLSNETRFKPLPLLLERGIASCMSVRVMGEKQPFGVLCAHSTKRRVFSSDDAHFLESVANLLAAAVVRLRKDDELRDGEKQLRRFIDGMFAFVGVLTPNGTLIEANRAALEAASLTPEDVLGKPFEETYWWSYSPEVQAQLRAAIDRGARGERSRYDVANRIGKDRLVIVDFMLAPILDEEGRVTHLIPSAVDITERKRAEERTRQQAALLDIAHDAIMVRDLEDRILFWNKGAERLYGWEEQEVLGLRAEDLLFREPGEHIKAAHQELLEKGTWRGELHQVTKDGRDIIVESGWTLVRNERGQPHAQLAVNTNITERKKLETELLRASQLSLIGELAAGIAHEVKNPLAGIKGAVDILIQRRNPSDAEVEVLEDVRHAVERIDHTVQALLQRARPRPVQLEPASLSDVVHRAVLLARHHLGLSPSDGENVSIVFRPQRESIVLPIDAMQIEDAVLNLVLNSIEAVEGNGKIVVRLSQREAAGAGGHYEAVIEVEDDGRGIDSCDLGRLFDPFYTTREGGTGLGLPAVRRIAQAHGGYVEVHSELGRGTTFRIGLPVPPGSRPTQP